MRGIATLLYVLRDKDRTALASLCHFLGELIKWPILYRACQTMQLTRRNIALARSPSAQIAIRRKYREIFMLPFTVGLLPGAKNHQLDTPLSKRQIMFILAGNLAGMTASAPIIIEK